MHLSILAKRTLKPYQTVFPLTAFAPQLREREVTARNFHTLDRTKMFECDVLMICEGDFRGFLPPAQRTREAEIELVERLRSRVPKIVWFDEADSSGRLRTYILPHVDIYLKAHLFRDKMDYKRPMITGDPHRDFFMARYHLSDDAHRWKGAPTDEELAKVRLGWNVGLGDWSSLTSRLRRYRWSFSLAPRVHRARSTGAPIREREIQVSYRVGYPARSEAVSFHRKLVAKQLQDAVRSGLLKTVRLEGRISRSKYLKELRNSAVVPSPFGWGEVCYRDFECFQAGSVLLKPVMDHMVTWPDYYIAGRTFATHRWDLSDFENALAHLLQRPDLAKEIAAEGRATYLRTLSREGGHQFADRVCEVLSPWG